MAFPFVLAAIGSFVSLTASRVISVVASRKFTEKSSKPSVTSNQKHEQIRKAEMTYLKSKSKRVEELVKIKADLAKMREVEILANIEIAKSQAERDERALEISESELRLKREELELAKARLQQEIIFSESQKEQAERALKLRERQLELMEIQFHEQNKLSFLYLQFQREREVYKINLKLSEIQSDWDRENWAGIISREEIKRLLIESQEKHRLLMMISPPDFTDCSEFNTHLQKEVRSEVKEFLEKYYPLNGELCPVEYYGKFFKNSIFDAEVKQIESDLSPVPTVIIYSEITDRNVYFHVKFWGLDTPLSWTLPWLWYEEHQKLIAAGLGQKESIAIIRQSIVKIHQLIVASLADLYYLGINPLHQPRLFEMEAEFSIEWIQSNFGILREIQQKRLLEYEQELALEEEMDSAIQRFVY